MKVIIRMGEVEFKSEMPDPERPVAATKAEFDDYQSQKHDFMNRCKRAAIDLHREMVKPRTIPLGPDGKPF
jgi:hypothetical protein